MPRYASLIYNGYWWSPERRALQVLIDHTQHNVNGWVRLKLYKGQVSVVARDSKDTLFDTQIATFDDDGGAYHQAYAHCGKCTLTAWAAGVTLLINSSRASNCSFSSLSSFFHTRFL